MKKYASFLIAGAACLPLTYDISRSGTIFLSVLIVILLAATAAFLTRSLGAVKTLMACLVFLFGTLCSSVSFFLEWMKRAGNQGDDMNMGQSLALLEGGLISFVGVLTIIVMLFAMRKA